MSSNTRPRQTAQRKPIEFESLAETTSVAIFLVQNQRIPMAVLWQLGVEFVQGYFVSAPEEVVLGA